jgi:hypothetical protein
MNHKTINLFGSTYFAETSSEAVDVTHYTGASVHIVYDNTTPAAKAFTAAVTDICTSVAHGFTTGCEVIVSSDGTLPAGLSGTPTKYYVIVGTADTFALSDSRAHALAGTDIVNIGDAGVGTHTITATVLSVASVKLQYSNDGVNWDDIASQTGNITADGNKLFNLSGCYYKYIKAVLAIGTGQLAVTGKVMLKSE